MLKLKQLTYLVSQSYGDITDNQPLNSPRPHNLNFEVCVCIHIYDSSYKY